METNDPIIEHFDLPKFKKIEPEKIALRVKELIARDKKKLAELLTQDHFTWENLLQPLDDMNDDLSKVWSPFSHLNAVMESEQLRKVYNELLPLLTDYHTQISQNEKLYNAIASIEASANFKKLSTAQQKVITNDLRNFKLAGIHLPADKKEQLAALQQEKSKCSTKFAENVLDATHAWTLHIADEAELQGLPAHALQLARENAQQRGLQGYVLTLDYPSYSTAMTYLKSSALRQKMYAAYVTRASDQGPNKDQWDNAPIMDKILKLRHEKANMVGFKNFVEYSLATKMAKTPEQVLKFLQDLVARSRKLAKSELQEVLDLAKKDGLTQVQLWDLPYYSEKLRKQKFDFNQEDVRPYFPIHKVLEGLFVIIHKIYGLSVNEEEQVETWHKDVKFFSVFDEHDKLRGGFYIDLYARPHKRDGAWMDDCRVRRKLGNNKIQYPIAYLTCNFMRPVESKPALLTHDDVITLFHEFGHCLHHILTLVDEPPVAGINGVPWDAVEFPSQLMENFCWEKESLLLLSEHSDTGEPLPTALFEKMQAAKNFQTGLYMLRQLEFSLFDFRLHLEYDPAKSKQVADVLSSVRKQTRFLPVLNYDRFPNSFSHIFAGGYAAGYYSYKWAEVLACDAYAEFQQHGIFNRSVGQSFMHHILEVGGVKDPMDAFIAFKKRPPTIDALLQHSGI